MIKTRYTLILNMLLKLPLASLDGEDSAVVLFLDNLNDLAETMQERMLEVRKANYTDLGKMQLFSSIENYVALLKANFDAYSD